LLLVLLVVLMMAGAAWAGWKYGWPWLRQQWH
jgi:hypothetical protein